ncbi:hypothetical protein U91I_03076 [alpha proteobacterium U9-1i]|nr:hypothetical protein U91I_03076 [alpha proteobacterium U9-1i]
MADDARREEIKSAIFKGSIADAVLLGGGFALYMVTDQLAWLIGGAVIGGAVFVLLLAQAGAFTHKP